MYYYATCVDGVWWDAFAPMPWNRAAWDGWTSMIRWDGTL